MTTQLVLPLLEKQKYLLQYFLPPTPLLAAFITNLLAAKEQGFVYIYAPPGYGKTHLLQALVMEMQSQGKKAAYFPLESASHFEASCLQELKTYDLVCLDNLDAIQDSSWQEAIFHLFNALLARGANLIISAKVKVDALENIQLPDLQSRLKSNLSFELPPLTEDQLQAALRLKTAADSLPLNAEQIRFIMTRLPRTINILADFIDILQEHSLREKRKITLPFIQDNLKKFHKKYNI